MNSACGGAFCLGLGPLGGPPVQEQQLDIMVLLATDEGIVVRGCRLGQRGAGAGRPGAQCGSTFGLNPYYPATLPPRRQGQRGDGAGRPGARRQGREHDGVQVLAGLALRVPHAPGQHAQPPLRHRQLDHGAAVRARHQPLLTRPDPARTAWVNRDDGAADRARHRPRLTPDAWLRHAG